MVAGSLINLAFGAKIQSILIPYAATGHSILNLQFQAFKATRRGWRPDDSTLRRGRHPDACDSRLRTRAAQPLMTWGWP